MKKINSQKPRKNNPTFHFLAFPLITLFLLGCSNSTQEKNAVGLPIIGNYDIVHAPMEGYEVGDTIFHKVPEWTYLTEDSIPLSSSEIEDKIWIADFFFATCPTICVPMNESLNAVRDSLMEINNDMAYISFTIDPEKDTPANLRAYRKEHNFTGENWYFLTGDQEETKQLALEGFQILAQEDKKAPGGFLHSSNFVLIDKNKHIRGVYNSLDEQDCQRLISDVKLLHNAK